VQDTIVADMTGRYDEQPRVNHVSSITNQYERRAGAIKHTLMRPPSPSTRDADGGRPSVDVALVGKDRYDEQSRAFSYVPARALKEHFTSPKKTTRLVQRIEDIDGNEINWPHVPQPQQRDHRAYADVYATPAPRTQAYVEEQQQYTSSAQQQNTAMEQEEYIRPEMMAQTAQYAMYRPAEPVYASSRTPAALAASNSGTRPSAARRQPTRKHHRSYNAYRTLDDYESDMDEFCDPDFYMTFTKQQAEQQQLQQASTSKQNDRSTYRSAQSVTSTPLLSRHETKTSYTPAPAYQPTSAPPRPYTSMDSVLSNADDWLESQLSRLRMYKEDTDPIMKHKKVAERMLLEVRHCTLTTTYYNPLTCSESNASYFR
jgi:hypothetical protein